MSEWVFVIINGFQEIFKDISSFLKKPLEMHELAAERASFVRYYIGYGLLLWTLIHFFFLIIPPRLTNIVWELNIMQELVENMIFPFFVSIGLIFYGQQGRMKLFELTLLKWVSWFCLFLAILYFLIVPWSVANTVRLYHQKRVEIISQNSQLSLAEEFKKKLNNATTQDEVKAIISKEFPNAKIPEKINNLEQYKKNIITNFSQLNENIKQQIKVKEARLKSTIKYLIKDLVKLVLSSFLAGTVFLYTWAYTDWARVEVE